MIYIENMSFVKSILVSLSSIINLCNMLYVFVFLKVSLETVGNVRDLKFELVRDREFVCCIFLGAEDQYLQ